MCGPVRVTSFPAATGVDRDCRWRASDPMEPPWGPEGTILPRVHPFLPATPGTYDRTPIPVEGLVG